MNWFAAFVTRSSSAYQESCLQYLMCLLELGFCELILYTTCTVHTLGKTTIAFFYDLDCQERQPHRVNVVKKLSYASYDFARPWIL